MGGLVGGCVGGEKSTVDSIVFGFDSAGTFHESAGEISPLGFSLIRLFEGLSNSRVSESWGDICGLPLSIEDTVFTCEESSCLAAREMIFVSRSFLERRGRIKPQATPSSSKVVRKWCL